MTLIIFMLAIIGYITGQYALKNGKNPHLWNFIGFFFGLFGLLYLHYLIKKEKHPVQMKEPKNLLPIPNGSDFLWYFVCENNKQNGPISFQALKDQYNRGKIDLSTYVWNETMDQWKKINELIEKSTNLP